MSNQRYLGTVSLYPQIADAVWCLVPLWVYPGHVAIVDWLRGTTPPPLNSGYIDAAEPQSDQ